MTEIRIMGTRMMGEILPRRVFEWLAAFSMMAWGVILSDPIMTLDAAGAADRLRDIAPIWFWASFCSIVGAVRVAALYVNGAWRPTPHIRAILAALSSLFLSQVSVGMALSGGPVAGLAIYPLMVIAEIYVVFRASKESRMNDMRAKRWKEGPDGWETQ